MLRGHVLQYCSTLSVSLLTASSFMALLWPSPIVPLLLKENTPLGRPITMLEVALINFLLMGGSIFGNLFLGYLINNFGRRGTLLICSVPGFISWVMILFGRSVELMLTARFIMGVAMSGPTAVSMMYISETVDTKIRGRLIIFCLLAAEIGAILATVLGPISYKIVALVGAFIPLLFFITFYFMPETPYYYLAKQKYIKAEEVLMQLRDKQDVSEELTQMGISVKESMQSKGTISQLYMDRKCRTAMIAVLGLKMLQDLSGGPAIQANMTLIFKIANTGLDENLSTLICIVVPFPFMFVASYLIDHYGRKILLYISILGTIVALAFEAIYFYMQLSNHDISALSWLPITGIFLSITFKAFGIASIPYLIMGEIFPPNLKGTASAVVLVFGGILSAAVALIFPLFSAQFGLWVSFLMFAVCCVFGFVFTVFFVPETKGKTLEEIQDSL